MYCKMCGEHLLKDMDLRMVFKRHYDTHISCERYQDLQSHLVVLPITNNVIYFEYLIDNSGKLNEDSIFMFNILRVLLKYTESNKWSVIFIYDEAEYISLTDETKYLLLHLGQNPIVFISLYPY